MNFRLGYSLQNTGNGRRNGRGGGGGGEGDKVSVLSLFRSVYLDPNAVDTVAVIR